MARDLALICLLYTSLLRRSEAANTNWGNISKQAEHYWLNIPIAKGGQRQKVKLEPVAISLLNKYLEVMGGRVAFEKISDVPFDRCPIFVALDRAHFFKRLTDHSINQIEKKTRRSRRFTSGNKRYSPHDAPQGYSPHVLGREEPSGGSEAGQA